MTPRRIAAPLAALIAFLLLSGLYASGHSTLYAHILDHWGVISFTFPFVDASNGLAAWECARLGVDVIAQNPCDVLGRAYSYSPLWLAVSGIPLGVGSTTAVGWVAGLVFLISLAFLPPPRRGRETAVALLATLSPSVAFAIERANPDIVVFVLAMLVGFAALSGSRVRLLAYPIALFAALFLKYYPLALMLLSLRERIATFLAVNFTALCLIAAFAIVYFSDLGRGLPSIASGPYYGAFFAATNLPFGLASTIWTLLGARYTVTSLADPLAAAFYAFLLLYGVVLCRRILKRGKLRSAMASLSRDEMIFLVIGSVLIVGCFFAGQSAYYRLIFFLFAMPGLLAIARGAEDPAISMLAAVTSGFIVFLMWEECPRVSLVLHYFDAEMAAVDPIALALFWLLWFVREVIWWSVVSVLSAVLIDFMWESETLRGLRSMAAVRHRDVARP